MRYRRNRNNQSLTIDMAPMVDVVFLLIIFFMVSTTFINIESAMKVELPQAASSQALTSQMPTVTVDKALQIFIGGQKVPLNQIPAILRQKISDTGITTVVYRADKVVPHGLDVEVYDMIKQSGAKKIAIATGGG